MDILTFYLLIHSSADGHLGGFTLTVTDNDPVKYFYVQVFVFTYVYISLRCLPRD